MDWQEMDWQEKAKRQNEIFGIIQDYQNSYRIDRLRLPTAERAMAIKAIMFHTGKGKNGAIKWASIHVDFVESEAE